METWGSGRIRFLELGNSWRWVVSFTPRPLYPEERAHYTYCITGRVGPRTGPIDMEKWKFLTLPSNSRPSVVRAVTSRYTDFATAALYEMWYLILLLLPLLEDCVTYSEEWFYMVWLGHWEWMSGTKKAVVRKKKIRNHWCNADEWHLKTCIMTHKWLPEAQKLTVVDLG
jgi:hypothetical protein